jgi:hypothetical protein
MKHEKHVYTLVDLWNLDISPLLFGSSSSLWMVTFNVNLCWCSSKKILRWEIQDGDWEKPQTSWALWSRDFAERLETHLAEVKHQGKLKHQHSEPLACGCGHLLHARFTKRTAGAARQVPPIGCRAVVLQAMGSLSSGPPPQPWQGHAPLNSHPSDQHDLHWPCPQACTGLRHLRSTGSCP